MSIGARIKERRVALQLSQGALAKRVNAQQQSVARWELGENAPRRHTIQLLAKELEVSPVWLEFGGVAENDAEWYGPTGMPKATPKTDTPIAEEANAPVYQCVAEDHLYLEVDSLELVDQRAPPHGFINAPHIYGFYLPDDRMAPRFKAGELIWCHPQRVPKEGEEAVAVPNQANPGKISMILGLLVQRDHQTVTLQSGQHKVSLESADFGFHSVVGLDLGR